MNKFIISLAAAIISVSCIAGGKPGPNNGKGGQPDKGKQVYHPNSHDNRNRDNHRHDNRKHDKSWSWGHAGENFWPGFIGGVVSTVVTPPPPPSPVIVNPPPTPVVVVQPAKVWVPGAYVDQMQPNGTIIRVWIPGHYR